MRPLLGGARLRGHALGGHDESGLVRLEPEDLERVGIEGKARLEAEPRALVLRADAGAAARRAEMQPPAEPAVRREGRPSVRLRGVRQVYGAGAAAVEALGPIDLDLTGPALHALVGPSGSGKTTLLHLIAGLERPTDGAIEVTGRGLGALSHAELAEFRRDTLAFAPQAAALAGHLSARENVDEPTANLDPRNAIAVARLLAAAARREGMLVLCATHDPSVHRRGGRRHGAVSRALISSARRRRRAGGPGSPAGSRRSARSARP